MSVILEDRPIEIVKEEVIDVLIHNYSHNFISNEAFERRLDVVIAATSASEMMAQIKDLDTHLDEAIIKQKEKQFAVNYSDAPTQESDWMVNIMGGSDRNGFFNVARNIFAVSIMGGATIDFTDARFTAKDITIYSFTLMGGNEFYVPENINIVCKAFSFCGGVSNKSPSMGGINAPTITIKGFNLMGATEIKLKQTIKEKFVAFANQMKSSFGTSK